METREHFEEWVSLRMAAAQPAGTWPDAAVGRKRLARQIARRRAMAIVLTGAAAALTVVLALPGTRVAAQRLWDRAVIGRIQVLTMDKGAVGFFVPEIEGRAERSPMASLEDASRAAGFSPRLPGPDVFSASPTYSVVNITATKVQLRTPAIAYLFDKAGGSAHEVPASWNGAVLELRTGPVIVANYDGVLLLQSLPFELITPPDFDLKLFFRIAFRALGRTESEAQALSKDFSLSPALLMMVPNEDRPLVHEFMTRSGSGVMIEGVYGADKTVAIWNGNGRVYALYPDTRPITREFIFAVANALQ